MIYRFSGLHIAGGSIAFADRVEDLPDLFSVSNFNNVFDKLIQFFRQFFMDCGEKYFGSYFWSNSCDCMVLATPFLMDKRKAMIDFKQSTVAKALGIEVEAEKLHDASYDIILCHAIYDKVCGKY